MWLCPTKSQTAKIYLCISLGGTCCQDNAVVMVSIFQNVSSFQQDPFFSSTQPDETELFNFVDGYSSWKEYLQKMNEEGTWGDHVILIAAASCFGCVVRVVSSIPNCNDIIIRPNGPVCDAVQLVLGHVFEEHYVSLRPCEPGKD